MSDTVRQPETSGRILIVDDAPENRLLIGAQLRSDGYKILEAEDGRDGIEMARQHDPDIIILDVMMPDMNGFEVCRIIRADEQISAIPIIMVTALSNVESRIEGKKAGADEFLSRPHNREELLVRVRTLIQVKRARVRLEEERHRLQLLYNISRAISTQLELEPMMADIITQTQAAVDATKGNIMLLDKNGRVTHKFLIRAGAPLEISDHVAQAVMTRGLGGWIRQNKQSEIIDDITQDDRWITLPDHEKERGSAIGVPLLGPDQHLVGILILNHPEIGYFSQEHKALLEAIGGTVATAIKNAHLFNEVSEEQRKLEAILAQSTDAIITMDESWHILHFNRMAELFFQLAENKVIGKLIRDLPALLPIIEIWENGGGPLQGHEIILDENKTLYATISPIQGVGYAAVLQDITELKRVEEMRLAAERAEKLKAKDTIARYLGPNLAEHVLNNVPGLMAQRQRRHAVVMFADLRDSTRFTRQFEADEVISRYNEFFTRMTEVVYKFEGTIFELTGDELLVAFNAPFDHEDAQVRALQTAVAMHKEFNLLRKEIYDELGAGFGMGIGIDQGKVVVGNVGAETRMTFRMVGMAVNVAHRLVEKAADGQIVVSESVFQDIQQSAPDLLAEITFAPFGPVTIKGREEPQILYRAEILH